MQGLLSAAQMRAVEGAAIAGGAVSGLELMERAGRGVVAAVFAQWPALAMDPAPERGAGPSRSPEYLTQDEGTRRAVVLCGPGNNGGDGFVVARLLRERGWAVRVFLHGDPERLPPDARTNCQRWRRLGPVARMEAAAVFAASADLWFDACFGTGLDRAIPDPVCRSLGAARERCDGGRGRLVAVDLPSGLCSDSGRVLGPGGCPPCDLTVSFHRMKPGHVLDRGPDLCGRTVVADIGLGDGDAGAVGLVGVEAGTARALAKTGAHKFAAGHALILSGPAGRTGAARLAARGCLRIGAGLVTLGVPPSARAEVAAQVTAVMVRVLRDATALAAALDDPRFGALCLGPGLGAGDGPASMVEVALRSRRPTVLDADALTLLAHSGALFARLHETCVLTPHAGEFARLFADIAARLAAPAVAGPAYSKLDATRDAAARAGCVVLFKGADTVIAGPDGRASIHAAHHDRAAPWLATAGSGDVLAGFVTGLLARGFAPLPAAETAAWLHVECARHFGPGLIAEDLPEVLPRVFRGLGL